MMNVFSVFLFDSLFQARKMSHGGEIGFIPEAAVEFLTK
jgi:hypothetical protein